MKRKTLIGPWQFRQSGTETWRPATVPALVCEGLDTAESAVRARSLYESFAMEKL